MPDTENLSLGDIEFSLSTEYDLEDQTLRQVAVALHAGLKTEHASELINNEEIKEIYQECQPLRNESYPYTNSEERKTALTTDKPLEKIAEQICEAKSNIRYTDITPEKIEKELQEVKKYEQR